MSKFLFALITVSEESIHDPKYYQTKEEAIAEMRLQFASVMEIPMNKISKYEEDSYDAMCGEDMAFCSKKGCNYNWAVVKCDGIQFEEKKGE